MTQNDRLVIDFFDINNIYLLRELKLVGVLEADFQDLGMYAIALVSELNDRKEKPEEFLVISALQDTPAHPKKTLKEI